MFKINSKATVLLLCAALSVGCVRRVNPDPGIKAAQDAINEATRNEAARYAPSELSKAREKLNLAERARKDDRDVEARRLSEQAKVDARYAQVRAQAEREQNAAVETRATAQTVQGITQGE